MAATAGNGGSLIGTGGLADCTKATVSGDGPLNMAMYIRGTYDGGNSFAATPADHKFAYKGDSLYQVVVNETKATSFSFKFAASDWKKEFAVKNSSSVKIAQQQEMAVADKLPSATSASRKACAVYSVIESEFQKLELVLACKPWTSA